MRVLTAIYAHPDDETFSAGGTFAKYSSAGARCTLFCATDGDAGKSSAIAVASKAELGALRREELRAAAHILGITALDFGGYPDGNLGGADQDELIGRIVAHVRRERPQVVITFAPEGAPNQHRDHKAISRAATAAFFLAGHPGAPGGAESLPPFQPDRLFYVTWAPPPPDAQMRLLGLPHTVSIDVRAFRDVELSAWRAHATQQLMDKHFQESAATDTELFALAAGRPQPTPVIDDFFAGL